MEFFYILEQLVDKYKIRSNTIFNVDESGYSTVQTRKQKIIAKRGKRQVWGITSGERGVLITVVCCVKAAGFYIPPMIIFKRKRRAPELGIGAPPCRLSGSGYINGANAGTPISVYNVAALIGEAYGRAATVGTAAGTFRGARIWQ